jgi:D-alanyl-lipoteichoic acid acyltransferase DltB (MBOAT superfamily)
VLFNSLHFFLFFPLVTLSYYALPHRFRWMLLLAASCYFYMALIPVYILILGFTIVVDYAAGLLIERAERRRRRRWLIASLVANVGVLAIFKYYDFFNWNVAQLARLIHWNYPVPMLELILPVGLSFHTFQSMSYTIEVYWRRQAAERHFGIFALYVMFYPQLVAGPIERPQNLLRQFREPHYFRGPPLGGLRDFDARPVTDGLRRMLWGLFKKIVIADRLAVVVDAVYNDPRSFEGPAIVVAVLFFAFQIYCDFSGYSDIALGAAQVMGFRLMTNFDRPFMSQSIAEFWRRWHISLFSWFRDYLYTPLALTLSRMGQPRGHGAPRRGGLPWGVAISVLVTFVLSGLWHGASWTMVTVGALHGFYIVFSLRTAAFRKLINAAVGLTRVPRLHTALRVATTFALVCWTWVFFRAQTVGDAWYVTTRLVSGLGETIAALPAAAAALGQGGGVLTTLNLHNLPMAPHEWALMFVVLVILMTTEFVSRRHGLLTLLGRRPMWIRWAVYYALVLSIVFFRGYGNPKFIYFQF